ncbi:MAG: type II toxin-antitoxin system VapC family toxin [Betaproteobacteria bacterium]
MNDAQQHVRVPAGGVELAGAIASGLRVMLDASALLKRYAAEAGHDRLLELFAQADGLLVAAHCQSEVAAALLRRRRDCNLPKAEFERVWVAARRDLADMVRVPLDDHVERFAFAAMEHEQLRVTDALHVGSALAANVDLFVTADRRLAQVARWMGLPAECLDAVVQTNREEEMNP